MSSTERRKSWHGRPARAHGWDGRATKGCKVTCVALHRKRKRGVQIPREQHLSLPAPAGESTGSGPPFPKGEGWQRRLFSVLSLGESVAREAGRVRSFFRLRVATSELGINQKVTSV